MAGNQSFYLSRALTSPVRLPNGMGRGRILEILAKDGEPPKVIACRLKIPGGIRTVAWENISLTKTGKRSSSYAFTFERLTDFDASEDGIELKHLLLDKQIMDVEGRKIVRVNDIRLAIVTEGTFVIAMDVGMAGLLRRLGVDSLVRRLIEAFGGSLSTTFIPWSRMEAFVPDQHGLKLSIDNANLLTMHPSDLADLVEDLDRRSQALIFKSMDAEHAAEVLEEMEPDAQAQVLRELPLELAADVLEQMPSDEVADILDEMSEDRAEELLEEMEKSASDEVRELMEYPDGAVGSLMSTDFLCFRADDTVDMVLAELRRQQPDAETMYSLYVVDTEERLTAIVPLPSLVISQPWQKLSEIEGSKRIHSVRDTDSIPQLVELVSKYSLLSVPVIDEDDRLVGAVVVDDVVYEMLKSPSRRWRAG
jgi:magnesium transporter